MKKRVALSIVAILVFSFCGWGSRDDPAALIEFVVILVALLLTLEWIFERKER